MSANTPSRTDARITELLSDRALTGLTEAEQRELDALWKELGATGCPEFSEMDAVVAACTEALCPVDTPSAALRDRLRRAADAWCAENCPVVGRVGPQSSSAPRSTPLLASLGWVAAAACLAVAVWVSRGPGPGGNTALPPSQQLARFEAAAPDKISAEWGPFASLDDKKEPPEQTGVTGKVVWSESRQTGFITFKGLKPNDPRVEQYQLWIIDSRGINQRISGAIFNATPDPATGEVIVPIEPRIAVDKAAIFALTIERPGGVWVSDVRRRVVLAALPKGG